MKRRYRKKKPLLTQLEQDIAILHRHKFEDESMEVLRQSLVRHFITNDELSYRQKDAVKKLAAPLRMQKKTIKAQKRQRKHYVYAISDGAFVKIGFAVSPEKRLAELQIANPSPLRIEAKIECPNYGCATRLEKKIHRACKKYGIRGEWFEMDAMCIFDNFDPKAKVA